MHLILYSKPGCHLCEGLQEKLDRVSWSIDLEVRDITTRSDWFAAYQYEIPVLVVVNPEGQAQTLPRLSPRASLAQVEQMLQKYVQNDSQ